MAEKADGGKWTRVEGYTRADGTKVRPHDRSNPNTSKGKKPKGEHS